MQIFLWLSAVILLCLAAGGYVFFTACLRRKELPWLEEEAIKKTSYGRFYEYMVAADLWFREMEGRPVQIQSEDGLTLRGLWIPAENPRGTILLAHGYRSTKLCDFGATCIYYHELGLNILVPDQRSHGKSQGRYITFGVKESGDMARWVDFHNRELGRYPMILCGLSMGASTMLYLADRKLPENVKGIIADCGFTSPAQIIGTVFRRVTHLPGWTVLWAADLFARIFAGFSLYEKDTRRSLASSRLPVLLIHGLADDFVPCEMTRQGHAACAGIKDLLLVEKAGHGLSFLGDRKAYTAKIEEFLHKYLEGQL